VSDESVKTVRGLFVTREAAELAIQHLVQQFGINRSDIFVEPEGDKNSAGTKVSGGDASHEEGLETRPALTGRIVVSADVSLNDEANAKKAFREAGADEVVAR
jgi:hypothetical protein